MDVLDGHAERRNALEIPTWRVGAGSPSAATRATTGHVGYAISQRVRKRIEEVFGWIKTVGNSRKTRYIGLGANQLAVHLLASAYNSSGRQSHSGNWY